MTFHNEENLKIKADFGGLLRECSTSPPIKEKFILT